MNLTKEKILAAISVLLTLFVLASARLPEVKDVEPVPPEESARSYRRGPGSVKPRLAPEQTFSGRDPFQAKDPWAAAAPALLAVPPAKAWPRALPGGPSDQPRSPADRLLVDSEPGAAK